MMLLTLAECRNALKISKTAMAKLLHVSRATYYRYENKAPAAALWLSRALVTKRLMVGADLEKAVRESGPATVLEKFLLAPNHPTQSGTIERLGEE